jgi:transposase-like protein
LYRSASGGDDASVPGRRVIADLDDVAWLAARREEGWSIRRIAASVGVDPTQVRQALRDAGLPPRLKRARPVPELADAAWLAERRRDRWNVPRIARYLHVDERRVQRALRDLGLPARLPSTPAMFPELHDVEWMRRQLETRTMADIARELGCSQRSVRDAARRAGRVPGPSPRRRPARLDDATWLGTELTTRSAADVASELGCDSSTVLRAARCYGVASPTQGDRLRFPELHDPAWLAANVYAGTAAEVAAQLGCCIASVTKARRRHRALTRQST